MSIKGFRSQQALQKKLGEFTEEQSIDQSRFVTVQEMSGRRHALDTVIHGAYQVGIVLTVLGGSNIRTIRCVAHGALKGDIIRLSNGVQFSALSIPDADTIVTSVELDVSPVGDTFTVWRHIVPACNVDGSLVTTPGPTTFVLDGVTVSVAEDTVAPVNNRILPVNILAKDYNTPAVSYHPNVLFDGTGVNLCTIDQATVAAVNLTTVAVDLVADAVDLTTIAVDLVADAVDLTTIAVNLVADAVDLTTIAVDLVADAVDLTTIAVDSVTTALTDGTQIVDSSYFLNGVRTEVNEDTALPVNNRAFPTTLLLEEYDNAPASYKPNVFFDGTGASLCTVDLTVSSQLNNMYARQADGFQRTGLVNSIGTDIVSYDALDVPNGVTGFISVGTFITGFKNTAVLPKISRVPSATIYHDYSTGNVTTAAWSSFTTETAQTTLNSFTKAEIFDSSGEVVMVGVGSIGNEVQQFLIVPGGNGMVEWTNSTNIRISFKARTTNITSGILIINFYL